MNGHKKKTIKTTGINTIKLQIKLNHNNKTKIKKAPKKKPKKKLKNPYNLPNL